MPLKEIIISGRLPYQVHEIDATTEPIRFKHEDENTPKAERFCLKGSCDFVLDIGYRAVVLYDHGISRNLIAQVFPIPRSANAT